MDDYSDPKDVLRAFKESGMDIPPEKPEVDQHYPPEDDYMYSVPYEAQNTKSKCLLLKQFFRTTLALATVALMMILMLTLTLTQAKVQIITIKLTLCDQKYYRWGKC